MRLLREGRPGRTAHRRRPPAVPARRRPARRGRRRRSRPGRPDRRGPRHRACRRPAVRDPPPAHPGRGPHAGRPPAGTAWRSPSSSSSRRCPSSGSARSTWSSATSTTATHGPGRPGSASSRCTRSRCKLVLPAAHPCAARGTDPSRWPRCATTSGSPPPTGTGHHALVVGTCRSLGGYEPDLRHRSNDADVQLELVRTTGAVALMPAARPPGHRPGPGRPRHRRSGRHPPAHDHHPRQPDGTRPRRLPDRRPRPGAPDPPEARFTPLNPLPVRRTARCSR